MSYADIWKTLSAVDLSDQVEKKMNLTYLSWAWAWGVLMEHYPEARFEVHPERWQENGTGECSVTVSIDECSRTMWLPIMDHKNNSIQNPTSRQISDSRMRCLVKCLALFGLGHYIFAGEDVPTHSEEPVERITRLLSDDQRHEILGLCMQTNTGVEPFVYWLGYPNMTDVPAGEYERAKHALEQKLAKMNREYAEEQTMTYQSEMGEGQ